MSWRGGGGGEEGLYREVCPEGVQNKCPGGMCRGNIPCTGGKGLCREVCPEGDQN